MKRILIVLISLLLCSSYSLISVNAEEIDINDIYNQQFEASGSFALSDSLPDDVADRLDAFDLEKMIVDDNCFNIENIFSVIFSFLKSGLRRPFMSFASIVAILLMSTAVGGITSNEKLINFVVTVGITASAVLPVTVTIVACVDAIKSCATFMFSFVPTFAAILVARGKSLTASSFSAVLLAACEVVNYFCSFMVVPLTGCQLALSISGSTLTQINTESVSRTIKKITMWSLSLVCTVFVSVLGLQTVIATPTDNISAKATKFVVGTTVPVVGATVSEALATVKGCIKVLGSSVAVYSIAALVLIALPIVIELVFWRLTMGVTAALSDVLNQTKTSSLLRSVDSAISVILGIVVLSVVLFIISITIVAVV